MWEFPKIRGTLFWSPYNKDPTISGTISGTPFCGNSHVAWSPRLTQRPAYARNLTLETMLTLKPRKVNGTTGDGSSADIRDRLI